LPVDPILMSLSRLCVVHILFSFLLPLVLYQMSQPRQTLTPLFNSAVWFRLNTRSLYASAHIKEQPGRSVLLSSQTRFCVISQAELPTPKDRRDVVIEPTLITCIDVEGGHTKVVGRTTLKIHFGSFAMKVEFLVTESNPGQSQPIVLGKDFIDQYVESPLSDNLSTFLIPEGICMPCDCAGLYCPCRPPGLAIRFHPVKDTDEL
jgi:hypothetical protein